MFTLTNIYCESFCIIEYIIVCNLWRILHWNVWVSIHVIKIIMISMINRFLFGIRVFLFSYLISGWTECSHYLPFHHTRHALKVWYEMHYFQIHSTRIIYIYIILSLHMLCPTSADVLGKSLIGKWEHSKFSIKSSICANMCILIWCSKELYTLCFSMKKWSNAPIMDWIYPT